MTTTDAPVRTDFLAFLRDRLIEEHAAASRRLLDAADPEHARRGLQVVAEVLHDLRAGRTPDRMTCDLLVVAYAGHPAFDPAWNRWRV